MTRYALIGPTYPYRGGIAHHTTLLAQALRREHDLLFISFSKQYPQWLFPGETDRDPSAEPLRTDAEYLLNPLNPLSWRKTLRRIRAWRPDVVVIPWWGVPFWVPVWSMLARGVKRGRPAPTLIFICHNVLPHETGRLGSLLPAVTRFSLAPGDGYLVHSRADGEVLRKLLLNARFAVTPLPTYAALGANATVLPVGVPADRPLLLFAGYVRHYKGLDVLLEALPLVLKNRPVHLLVAGEFWGRFEQYQNQVTRLGLEETVTLHNRYLPDEEMVACVRRAEAVVLPYRNATQSAVIQFAFGQGTPVITTDVGGLAEVVTHGRTGLVVPPEDPQALAEAIERFFAEDLGPAFNKAIIQEQERFSWDIFVRQLEEIALSV